MGDFNADLLVDSADSRYIQSLAKELSLQVVEHKATHCPNGHFEPKTWIDLILVDNNDKILTHNNIPPGFRSRHNLIDVEISLFVPKPPQNTFSYRKFKNITAKDINQFLVNCNWSPLHSSDTDLDTALNCLNTNIKTAIDELAPLKTINPKKQKHPWINTELQFLLDKQKATEKRYMRTKNKLLLTELIKLSEQIEILSNTTRNSFIHGRLDEAVTNGQDFWRELRHLGLLPNSKSELHGFSPDELNNHFSKVSYSDSEYLDEMEDTIVSASDNGFNFNEINFNDVVLAVAHFKSQATGIDGIPHSVIAKSLPTVGPYLVQIFNESLKKDNFPLAWKTSLLIPLKKVPIPSLPSDFRPIALLCFLSKVLEKLVHDQITLFLKKNSILDPMQTGFRKHSSTETALLKLTDDIRIGMSKRLITILLQFDFSKAFDTVSSIKLLKKLRGMGFSKSALIWLKSYLEDRQLKVISKLSSSEPRDINLGVPQGSVLGPLLFCLYINDLQDHLGSNVFHLFYADDLQIYIQVPPECILEGIKKLSLVANGVSRWAKMVSLHLNPDKTRAIYFGTGHFVDQINELNLPGVDMGEGVIVPFVQEIKSLGVILDSKLSWEPHVVSVGKKVNRVLYTLRFIRHFRDSP